MRERLKELLKNAPRNTRMFYDQYADYLLANGVIVPPCNVGDVVCFIERNGSRPIGTIDEIEIAQIAKTKDGFNAKGRFKGNHNEFEIRSFKIDNYSFFLTKEEAEAALRKEGARE